MHKADLRHSNNSLQRKLERLYTLNRHTTIDLSFRPPYLKLLQAFDNPHHTLPPTIHVAGTNGKGSIIAILRAILETAGYRVHTYTSPHLKKFNERIVLAGKEITDCALSSLIDEALTRNAEGELTFFEITTAMAFAAFSRTPADIVLLETGLGGRLDCTNVIKSPIATIINTISLDHTEYLGETLKQIALEKAGIMKQDCPCIIGPQTQDALNQDIITTFETHAQTIGSPLTIYGKNWTINEHLNSILHVLNQSKTTYKTPNIIGKHQIYNFATAITCLKVIQNHCTVTHSDITKASQSITWPARLEKITHIPLHNTNELWLDGGHNDSAGAALSNQTQSWHAQDGKPLHLILAMKGDKNPQDFLAPIAKNIKSITLIPLDGVGAYLTHNTLTKITDMLNLPTPHTANNIHDAITLIENTYGHNLRILTCGSLYLAAQI